MEFQKTINLLEKTYDNKDLLKKKKKKINKEKKYSNNKETKTEKPVTFFTINHNPIV